jgi:hypothetical protein
MLAGRFLTEFYRMVAEWADWAGDIVGGWPDDPGKAEPSLQAIEETARRVCCGYWWWG